MTQATDERQFTEQELTAIVADRVQRETASITAEIDKLRTENTELANKLDAEISGRTAAEKAKADTEAEFAKFKADQETEKAALARKDDRIKAVREAAAHLDDKFFADEKRVTRIVAMDEDAFTGYLDDLKVTAGVAPKKDPTLPRESAMEGQAISGGGESGSAAKAFLQRTFVSAKPKEA